MILSIFSYVCWPSGYARIFGLSECQRYVLVRMGGVGQNGSRTTTWKRWLTSNQGTTNDRRPLCSRRPIPSPMRGAKQNLVHKTPPYPLLGHDFPSPALRTRGTSPWCANPNKALYCPILWLTGISSSAEPKKTFHLVPKPGSCCLLKTTPLPTP